MKNLSHAADRAPRLSGLRRALALSAALAAVASAQSASAQSATGGAVEEEASDLALGEIIVTATKRNETQLRAPVSVTALSGADIAHMGTTSLSDLDVRIPNLRVSESIAFPAVTMRGVGSGTGTSAFDQTVSVFNDGVYAARSRQFLLPFFDVDHIEVLRGPQGAIVGKNTSAGAIVIVSAQPTQDLSGSLDAAYNFTLRQSTATGVLSGPIGGGFGFRIAGQYDQMDRGYLYNTATGTHDPRSKAGIVRGILSYADGGFDARLKLEYSKRNLRGGFLQAAAPNNPAYALDYQRDTGGGGDEFDRLENFNASLNMTWDAGDLTVSSISGFSWYDSLVGLDPDGIRAALVYANIGEDYRQYSQELRFATRPGEPLELVSGIYYQQYTQHARRWVRAYLSGGGYSIRFDQKDEAVSAFAELLWNVSPTLRLRGGGRYTYESKAATYSQLNGPNAYLGQGAYSPGQPFDARLSEGLFDPSVVLQWEPSSRLMAYVSFTRGSKGGAFQGDVSSVLRESYEIGPERATSYEIGTKFRFWDNRGRLGITLFNTRYSALQLAEIDPNITDRVVFAVRNAGKAVSRGVEVEGALRLTEWLTLNASGAYLDAHYTDYPAGDCAPGQTPDDAAAGTCNYNGRSLPFAPKWNGNMSADVRIPVTGDWNVIGNANVQYSSRSHTNTTNDPRSVQNSYAKLDLTLGLQNDHWRIALLARNVTDKLTQSWTTLTPPAAGPGGLGQDVRLYKVDQPRTVAVQVGYRF